LNGWTTKYTFSVNGQSVVGNLTWFPIGTLETLAVTDRFNTANTQTCSYGHDDLNRIASYSCGSLWAQTFGYDPFGNINKTGNSSFNPSYSPSTNQMTSIGSSTPTYDSNGNVTNDFLNTYAWDANGRPVTADGVGLTYDALGRMVEQNRSGTYTEIAYSPGGAKLALMSGSALQKGFVPLTGGAMAVYNSSGLAYYRHSDWLGSARVGSTASRTLYFDLAYAPFGEVYASTGTTDASFTGQNQDTASNLYDFPAREYGIQGRWPSPDPAGIGAANAADPQTWNRYAYVRNSPAEIVDPSGMMMKVSGGGGGGGGGGFSMLGVYDGSWAGDEPSWDPLNFSDLTLSGFPVDPFAGSIMAQTVGLDAGEIANNGTPGGIPPWSQIARVCGGIVGGPQSCEDTTYVHQMSAEIAFQIIWPEGMSPNNSTPASDGSEVDDPIRALAGEINKRPIGKFVAVVYGGSLAAGAGGYGVYDIAQIEEGALFGTRFGGNTPLFNSSDFLRVGWSYQGAEDYVFRIGGDLLENFMDNPHINLWPPSWWFGPPGP
jgi:RHS repeat-associated protein